MPDYTSIRVTEELADELYDQKERGESYEDVIWRLLDDDGEDGDSGDVQHVEESRETDPNPEPRRSLDEAESDVEAFLEDVDFPGSRDRAECVAAVQAAYDYLQREGSATMREFVREVMPEYPVGYDVPVLEEGERYRGAWWRKVVKPGLKKLPDVESPPAGASDWTVRKN